MEKQFAVLIINYNGKQYLEDCINSLQDSDAKLFADCFIVDNSSSDGSAELVSNNFPEVKLIQTGANFGFSGAYNFAHKYLKQEGAKYNYYYIVNNDTISSDPNIFSRIQQLFAEDKRIAVINPTIIDENSMIQFQGGKYIFWTGTTLAQRVGRGYQKVNKVLDSSWSTGCALFIRTEVFEELGGFDDYFMYQEDVGLSWKSLNAGYRVVTDCYSSIIHLGGRSTKTPVFEHYYSERNRIILYWQNLSLLTLLFTLPVLLIGRILLLPMQKSLVIALAKIKAIVVGLLLLPKFKRYNNSVLVDLRTIRYFRGGLTLN